MKWPAAVGRTDRFEHVAAGKYYSLAPGGKLRVIWLLALQLSLSPQQQHYDNGKDDLAKMQFSQADEQVDLALQLDPNFVPALILKARLALFAHRPDIAKSCLIRAVAVEPSSESAQFYLGVFYYLQNDFTLGISPLEAARSLSPKDPMPYFYLATSGEALGHVGGGSPDSMRRPPALPVAKDP